MLHIWVIKYYFASYAGVTLDKPPFVHKKKFVGHKHGRLSSVALK